MPNPVPVGDVIEQLRSRLGQAVDQPEPRHFSVLAAQAAAWADYRVPMLLAARGYGAAAVASWSAYQTYALRLAVAQVFLLASAGTDSQDAARREVKMVEEELSVPDPLILLDATGGVIEPTVPPFAGGYSAGTLPGFATDLAALDGL